MVDFSKLKKKQLQSGSAPGTVGGKDPKDLPAAAPQPAHSGEIETLLAGFRAEVQRSKKDIQKAASALHTRLTLANAGLKAAREELAGKTEELAGVQAQLADKTKQLEAEQATSQALAKRVGDLEDTAAKASAVEQLKEMFAAFMEEVGEEIGKLPSEVLDHPQIKKLLETFDASKKLEEQHTKVLTALSAEGDTRPALFKVAMDLGLADFKQVLEDISEGSNETDSSLAKAILEEFNESLVAGACLQEDPEAALEKLTDLIDESAVQEAVTKLVKNNDPAVAELAKQAVAPEEPAQPQEAAPEEPAPKGDQ
jgi:glutamine synthetase adenylyltransferase